MKTFNTDHIPIQVSLGQMATLIRWSMSVMITFALGGATLTMWYQTRIERRLDRAITYEEFLKWEEGLRHDLPQFKSRSMGLIHTGERSSWERPPAQHVSSRASTTASF
jgi:hypothetical protein